MSKKIKLKKLASMNFTEGMEYINKCYDLELDQEDFHFNIDASDAIGAAVIEAMAHTSSARDEIEADGISYFYYNIRYIEEEQDIKKLEDLYGFEIEDSDEDEDENGHSDEDVDYDYFNQCIEKICNNNNDIKDLLKDLEDALGVWGAVKINNKDSGDDMIKKWQESKKKKEN
ncbi:hypothetical protein [[Clostridium] fimetarium]|uniref:Uncharacterized protein n=1 Tax=[Clostridium] fimetarium TaxID=99656 RepID=A0A1I0QVW1_9FIRM|nr:hypothetical protein [[Clostridium] fimetarium]SEW31589.1 hypothetical protein SAMN05421659_109163 [[Clostridium] fimetarium]